MHIQSGQQQRNFFYLFLGMFALHAVFMVIRFSDDLFKTTAYKPQTTDAIKVTFLPEAGTKSEPGTAAKKQIVQSEDSASNEKPKTDAFLSDKDRSFDRQTIARNVDKFQRTAAGNSAATQSAQKAAPAAPEKVARDMKNLKLSDLGMQTGEVGMKPQVARAPASEMKKGIRNGDPLSQGFSATNDYVQEVGLGDFTHLNTVEFKFFGFYHRIRQKLEQFWGNSIQEKSRALFRSGRRVPAGEDLITSLRITLNAEGEIVGVKILGTSGVKELDDAAIESFNMAGPFPNPPKELLVNGKATIEWGFVVKS